MASAKSSKPTNRIVLILGGKGGTGKTLFCLLTYYFLIKDGLNVIAYDSDVENPEFHEYHASSTHPVQLLNFMEVSEAKTFFTDLATKTPDVALFDMPGAHGQDMRSQIKKFGLFKIAEKLGYRVTIVTVLNNDYNTINSLELMMGFCQEEADYVAVKNQLWAQEESPFKRWNESPTRTRFVELNGIEIEMPVLDRSTCSELHEGAYSFFQLDQLSFGDQILVESFLEMSAPQVELASPYISSKRNGKGKKATATTVTTASKPLVAAVEEIGEQQ
ncbi:hypothetical protein IQ268_16870 [Oculatella sp. LEGE 06141]|uniref:nucleotide-binding protein n=1 Tax=Oculatella sp. LEGE 06141 TaxID=1828648 RepID=UPI001880A14C|nr:hypothetical protein [Oculatella sp. LEGE 06141]MBE9180238.1 hypothetical protein [Oculatella sp. LEGE 06141]